MMIVMCKNDASCVRIKEYLKAEGAAFAEIPDTKTVMEKLQKAATRMWLKKHTESTLANNQGQPPSELTAMKAILNSVAPPGTFTIKEPGPIPMPPNNPCQLEFPALTAALSTSSKPALGPSNNSNFQMAGVPENPNLASGHPGPSNNLDLHRPVAPPAGNLAIPYPLPPMDFQKLLASLQAGMALKPPPPQPMTTGSMEDQSSKPPVNPSPVVKPPVNHQGFPMGQFPGFANFSRYFDENGKPVIVRQTAMPFAASPLAHLPPINNAPQSTVPPGIVYPAVPQQAMKLDTVPSNINIPSTSTSSTAATNGKSNGFKVSEMAQIYAQPNQQLYERQQKQSAERRPRRRPKRRVYTVKRIGRLQANPKFSTDRLWEIMNKVQADLKASESPAPRRYKNR